MKNHRISLADVAREAGVSQATVSLVLNQKADQLSISENTRRRVLEVAHKMSYRPRVPPMFDAQIKTPLRYLSLAFVDPSGMSFHEFLAPAICEIGRAAGEDDLLIQTTEGIHPDEVGAFCKKLRKRDSGGMIIFTFEFERPAWLSDFIDSEIPFVIFNRDFGDDIPCVIMDHEGHAYEQTGRLLSLGHRRIGFLGSPTGPARLRAEGYRERLRKAGRYDPALERECDYTLDVTIEACSELIRSAPDMTALFCSSDLIAVGALRAARRMGKAVPQDFSIISIDGYEFGAYCEPPLSTIRYPRAEMGRAAIKLLYQVVKNKAPKPPRVILRGQIIEGGSTAAPRNKL